MNQRLLLAVGSSLFVILETMIGWLPRIFRAYDYANYINILYMVKLLFVEGVTVFFAIPFSLLFLWTSLLVEKIHQDGSYALAWVTICLFCR